MNEEGDDEAWLEKYESDFSTQRDEFRRRIDKKGGQLISKDAPSA